MCHLFSNKKTVLFSVLSILILSGTALSAGMYGEKSTEMKESNQPAAMTSMMLCANKLMDSEIKNNMNEVVGSVNQIVFDDKQSAAYYVILTSDNKLYPVPFAAFDTTGENCMLNISKSSMMQAPIIDRVDLPELSSSNFRKTVNDFYSEQISSTQEKSTAMRLISWMKRTLGAEENPTLSKYSSIENLDVQNLQDKKIGVLNDVVIDKRQGKLAFGLVRFGGFWGMGKKTAAVPWSSLSIQPHMGFAKLDADRERLNAAVLENGNIDKLSDPQFARQIYTNFGNENYFEVYGYEPAMEEKSNAAWMADSKYNQNFDAKNITTVEGTIQQVGTFMPEKNSTPGLWLKVRSKDGEVLSVQAGPRDYIMQQDVKFLIGNVIKITGSKTVINLQSIIMPLEIEAGDKTISLRDEEGKPMWNLGGSQPSKHQEMKEQKSEESGEESK